MEELEALAALDPRIVVLTGDMGFALMEPFAARFPSRFVNVGVAEQNMVGIATGLAEGGYLPFVYSIGTFASLRPFEFIRDGPVVQRLPVRIISAGGGFDYGAAGVTHHALEDVALMRTQFGLVTVVPADTAQARAALAATWNLDAPVYYRIGKDGGADVPGVNGRFELGRLHVLREGLDVALIALGPMAAACQEAGDVLATRGIAATVAVVSCVSPPPVDDLLALLRRHPIAVCAEVHVANGGVGSLVAEVVAEHAVPCRLVRCAVTSLPADVGSRAHLEHMSGLSAAALASTAERAVALARSSAPLR
jgi:transketolase